MNRANRRSSGPLLCLLTIALTLVDAGCSSTAPKSSGAAGAGGASPMGGSVGSGGTMQTGGVTGTGGAAGTGGVVGLGGATSTGGSIGTGGATRNGGSTGTGGSTSNGGSTGAGGSTSTGGARTGGSGGGGTGTGGTRASGGSSGGAGTDGGAATDAAGGGSGTGGTGGGGGSTVTDGAISTGAWWKPLAGLKWQWQIGGGTIDPKLAVDVFDIDWEQDASVVAQLHQAGKKVICYVSVGSWEDWRPDAANFPAAVLGNDYPGWPGEKFVDIRAQALRDLMAKRFDVCKTKGFDAVEPDNMDVFSSNSGFPLTQADGVAYAKWLASECHNRGMAIVQKNASEITTSIQSVYDGALTEDCYDGGNWCADMQAYIDANKPVFACEYNSSIFSAACTWGTSRKYSFILKSLDLNAPVTFCP